jgi:hypothetical protein
LALTWSSDTLELVAIASPAFACYYLLQCLVALIVTQSASRKAESVTVAIALAFITIFAVPAS